MHENHAGGDQRDLQHFPCTKNSVAVRVSAKHAVQHSGSDGEIGRPKEYPGDANRGVGGEAGEESSREIVGPFFVLEQSANNSFDHEIRAVEQAPNDERPGRTVPETTEEHDYDEVRGGADRRDLISAQRNVKVVPQKC